MDTRKLITEDELTNNPFFMAEFFKKLSYIADYKKQVDYSGQSRPMYFIVNQKQWGKNECTMYVNVCDGKEHQNLEFKQLLEAPIKAWRFAVTARIIEDVLDDKKPQQIEIIIEKVIKQELTKPTDLVNLYPADEDSYNELIATQALAMSEAYKKVNNIK